MRVIGHRGCPDRAPENTVAAFRKAAEHVDWIELDVRRCGTGELVVFHDATLDRLLGVDAALHETAFRTLRSYTVDGSSQRVPILEDALAAIPNDVPVNIELKQEGIVEGVAAVSASVDTPAIISSFSPSTLEEWRVETETPTAYVTRDPGEAAIETAVRLDCDYLHPQYEPVLDDPEVVATAHARGLELNVWTLRSPDPYPRLESVGVDGVIVDDWAYANH